MQKIKGDYRGLLGRRLRTLRKGKGLTQEKLGDYADIDYKFLGAVERGQQNPSIDTLAKIADALCVELPELFRFEHGMEGDRDAVEARVNQILKMLPENDLRKLLSVLNALYPQF